MRFKDYLEEAKGRNSRKEPGRYHNFNGHKTWVPSDFEFDSGAGAQPGGFDELIYRGVHITNFDHGYKKNRFVRRRTTRYGRQHSWKDSSEKVYKGPFCILISSKTETIFHEVKDLATARRLIDAGIITPEIQDGSLDESKKDWKKHWEDEEEAKKQQKKNEYSWWTMKKYPSFVPGKNKVARQSHNSSIENMEKSTKRVCRCPNCSQELRWRKFPVVGTDGMNRKILGRECPGCGEYLEIAMNEAKDWNKHWKDQEEAKRRQMKPGEWWTSNKVGSHNNYKKDVYRSFSDILKRKSKEEGRPPRCPECGNEVRWQKFPIVGKYYSDDIAAADCSNCKTPLEVIITKI